MRTNHDSKHIVLIIRLLNGRSGGAERIYCELANLLQEHGHRVTCLHFDAKPGEPFYHLNPQVERINVFGKTRAWTRWWGGASKFMPTALRHRADFALRNQFFVGQLRDYFRLVKPDIAVSVLPPANTAVLIAAEGLAVQVIACNHNVPEQDYENPGRWGANPIERKLRLSSLDNAAAIHVLFPKFSEWFPEHLQERIVAIPNYISPVFKMPVPRPDKERTILAVGRLAAVKNYGQLVKSWSSIARGFPDWKVKIFGTGPLHDELMQEIVSSGLKDTVTLAGHSADLSEEYAKASIFCHPADFEGFGLSVAEALFLETPVVFYADCTGVNEFVKDGFNGLAVERNGSEDNLASALSRLMSDSELRSSLGRNGPQSVSHFTFDEYCARWLKLVDDLGNDADH